MKHFKKNLTMAVGMICLLLAPQVLAQSEGPSPRYRRAAYAKESVSLGNDHIRINMFKGAPFPNELAAAPEDDWSYPPLLEIGR